MIGNLLCIALGFVLAFAFMPVTYPIYQDGVAFVQALTTPDAPSTPEN